MLSITNHTQSNMTANTSQWFVLFLGLYFLIWSLAPALLTSSVALDVSEGINWGSEWQWGYYKHPPLSSWVLYSFYKLFGHIGPYLLSQLSVLLTLFLVYKLAYKIFSNTQAWLGTLLTLAIYYYSYPTLEFNHNIAQFPIWAGLSLLFYNAVTANKYRDWLWFGVVGGLGMLTKYSVIFLLLPMLLFLLLPKQRRLLKQPKPWLATALMFIIFAPHLIWLIQNNWLTLAYASSSSHNGIANSQLSPHLNWVNFLLAQLVAHVPLLVIVCLLRQHFQFKRPFVISTHLESQINLTAQANIHLLWYIWITPLLLLIVLSLVFGVGLRDLWGMPMWSLSGLVVASLIKPDKLDLLGAKITNYVAVWLTFATILMLIYLQFGQAIRHKPSRMDWPEQALSLQAQKTWDALSTCQWDSVSGDRWLTALVAMNAEASPFKTTSTWPSQMINGPAEYSLWMTPTRLLQHGTFVIEFENKQPNLPLLDALPKDSLKQYQGQWKMEWPKSKTADPLIVSWHAFIPKRCAK